MMMETEFSETLAFNLTYMWLIAKDFSDCITYPYLLNFSSVYNRHLVREISHLSALVPKFSLTAFSLLETVTTQP
jgi:hypothetical protein